MKIDQAEGLCRIHDEGLALGQRQRGKQGLAAGRGAPEALQHVGHEFEAHALQPRLDGVAKRLDR